MDSSAAILSSFCSVSRLFSVGIAISTNIAVCKEFSMIIQTPGKPFVYTMKQHLMDIRKIRSDTGKICLHTDTVYCKTSRNKLCFYNTIIKTNPDCRTNPDSSGQYRFTDMHRCMRPASQSASQGGV